MTRSLPTGSYTFFIQLYTIVNDRSSDQIISWSKNCNNNSSFVVREVDEFRRRVLPESAEFGRNFSEFVSELLYHRFESIGRFEFVHENFVRGRPELLRKMVPRKAWNEKFAERLKVKRAKAKARKARSKVVHLLQDLQI
ncbi:unnamed protein product [Microthlaspi erraticum]|uniref:HSF-type DNA-binding domain-containing protein n=1 Tax=Microthlaspi erraticum TaxID=1685480 RepID=A0A6D2LC02_9BRAS|nr:unnamed protein product [Microthlaspi erraticum]